VWTAEGLIPIEQVTPGQLVLSRDDGTGELGWKRVVRTFVTADQATLTLSLRDDAGGEHEEVEATAEHPFWLEGRGWVGAGSLRAGERVLRADGRWLRVERGEVRFEASALMLMFDKKARPRMRRIHQPPPAVRAQGASTPPRLRSLFRGVRRLAAVALLGCAALACAGAPSESPREASSPGNQLVRPRFVKGSFPPCPPEATAHQLDVQVRLECLVTTEGATRDCRVLKGHPLLNDTSLRAASTFRFEPGKMNGKPADVWLGIPFRFACVQGK
jgi:TonB family protein